MCTLASPPTVGVATSSCTFIYIPSFLLSGILYIPYFYIHPCFAILNDVIYYSKGLPLNAAHERLCSLRGNSLNVANWAGVTPSTIPVPSDPGATTSISLMYLHAVFGLFQYARANSFNLVDVFVAEMGKEPLAGLPFGPVEISKNKYPDVISHPAAWPTAIHFSTARTGHTPTYFSS